MPFEGVKIHAKIVSSLRAKRSNRLGLLRLARNDKRDIFDSHKNSMNRKSPNFIKVNTLPLTQAYCNITSIQDTRSVQLAVRSYRRFI
jgi:hypothetical protein